MRFPLCYVAVEARPLADLPRAVGARARPVASARASQRACVGATTTTTTTTTCSLTHNFAWQRAVVHHWVVQRRCAQRFFDSNGHAKTSRTARVRQNAHVRVDRVACLNVLVPHLQRSRSRHQTSHLVETTASSFCAAIMACSPSTDDNASLSGV